VSKGHLAIEQCMDDLISAALPHPESVLAENRFSFSRKGHICQALSLGQHDDDIWKVFWAVNQLMPRDNQDGNPATIRMRMRRCRGDEGRA
jgi:hypothetical protein